MHNTMRVAFAILLSNTAAFAQTVSGVSQISDGQVQAPATSATPTTSWSYENPFTVYTTQTDSLGVITGQPSVVTSQPEVMTSQPPAATNPTLSGYWYGNSTTTSTGSAGSSSGAPTTLETSTVTQDSSASGSRTAIVTPAQATGGAVSNKVAGAGVALVVLGLGFSLL